MLRVVSVIIGLLLCCSSAWAGPIYVHKSADGVVHFTSRPPPPGVTAKVFTAKSPRFSVFKVSSYRGGGARKLFKNVYGEIIEAAATASGVTKSLIKAVIHAESAFNPRAISPKGARGLMQLMPGTSQLVGVRNAFDPHQNIHGGTRYLAFLLRRYDGNLRYALAAYNAGPGAVDQFSGIPPYSETQQYVRRVLDLKRRYESGV